MKYHNDIIEITATDINSHVWHDLPTERLWIAQFMSYMVSYKTIIFTYDMTFDLQAELKIVSNPNSIKKEKNKNIHIHMWHNLLAERLWVYSNVSQWYMVLWKKA